MKSSFATAFKEIQPVSNRTMTPGSIEVRTQSWKRDVDAEFLEMLQESFRTVRETDYVTFASADEFDRFIRGD